MNTCHLYLHDTDTQPQHTKPKFSLEHAGADIFTQCHKSVQISNEVRSYYFYATSFSKIYVILTIGRLSVIACFGRSPNLFTRRMK
jgi:hypothetical protein